MPKLKLRYPVLGEQSRLPWSWRIKTRTSKHSWHNQSTTICALNALSKWILKLRQPSTGLGGWNENPFSFEQRHVFSPWTSAVSHCTSLKFKQWWKSILKDSSRAQEHIHWFITDQDVQDPFKCFQDFHCGGVIRIESQNKAPIVVRYIDLTAVCYKPNFAAKRLKQLSCGWWTLLCFRWGIAKPTHMVNLMPKTACGYGAFFLTGEHPVFKRPTKSFIHSSESEALSQNKSECSTETSLPQFRSPPAPQAQAGFGLGQYGGYAPHRNPRILLANSRQRSDNKPRTEPLLATLQSS